MRSRQRTEVRRIRGHGNLQPGAAIDGLQRSGGNVVGAVADRQDIAVGVGIVVQHRQQSGAACADADIVIADRRLPRGCTPAWLKLDRIGLRRTGGLAIDLGDPPRVATVANRVGSHPWAY